MSTEAGKPIVLKSSDNETFEIEEKVAKQSQTLQHMIDDECADAEIPLPNVTAKTLALVIEYCKKVVEGPEAADLKAFEAEFLKVHQNTLFDLILAADYLNIKSLLDVTCQAVANMIVGKQPEEIREMFNIKNDFTPEEEAQVRSENAWAFQ